MKPALNQHTFDPTEIAREVLGALHTRRQIAPLSDGDLGLDLPSAYCVAEAVRRLREERGERVVGRKIGFTNTTIWAEYGVNAPIWSYVYDTTLHQSGDHDAPFDLSGMVEPRLEPEIVLGLKSAPEPGMDERALLACIEWVAHGFEIVQSIFPGWRFTAADTIAAFGLHGALLVGPPEPITPENAGHWHGALAHFDVTLLRDGTVADQGRASNVLGGGPLSALAHLIEVLAHNPGGPALAAGEIISTGTLTRALPIAPGETWTTTLTNLSLSGLRLALI